MKYNNEPYSRKIDKAWGYEMLYAPEDFPAVAKALYGRGGNRISFQYHEHKDEVLCLISGEAILWLENDNGRLEPHPMELSKGFRVVAGQKHRIQLVKDSTILEVSEHELDDTIRLSEEEFNKMSSKL
jgi:mannose-6-phosphate isomerase-like protein (cupin superfamily)